MTDSVTFLSRTPRLGLPNLFAGQSQKEFFVNEAHAIIDMLLQPTVAGVVDTPPAGPAEGETWIVGDTPEAEFASHATRLAGWQGGGWLFVDPTQGMLVRDLSTGGALIYNAGWQALVPPADPVGGTIVDTEGRLAISNIIETLRAAGVFPVK